MREPDHYSYAPYFGRPRIVWPEGNKLALAVWYQQEPDITNYGHRDYGNRVAFERLAHVMAEHGVRGSVSLNVALCDHLPEIVERCCELDWELFSHGVYKTRYLYELTED